MLFYIEYIEEKRTVYYFGQSSSQWRGVGFVITSQIWIAGVDKVNIVIIIIIYIITIVDIIMLAG